MRPFGSIRSRDATACETMVARRRLSWASVFNELYFACTGQIGIQLALPSQRSPTLGAPTAPIGL
jgi:hypothetical protein